MVKRMGNRVALILGGLLVVWPAVIGLATVVLPALMTSAPPPRGPSSPSAWASSQ